MPKGLKGFQKGNKLGQKFNKGSDVWDNPKSKKYWFNKKEHPSPKTEFKKGYVPSEKIRKKLSKSAIGNTNGFQKGVNNLNWKGGKSRNKERLNWYTKQRQRRKRGAEGSHTLGEWENLKVQQYNWICPACGKSEPEIVLTEDHIIPISKGGSDNIKNIQPLCRSCNSIKHTKIIKYKL